MRNISASGDVSLHPLDGNFAEFRRRVIFDCCKWDPQVGDYCTIADHAAILAPAAAQRLSGWAEQLAAETESLEMALQSRPDLWKTLSLPSALTRALRNSDASPRKHIRLMRFDFHPTPEGWRISEVNSDVPGGLAESTVLPTLAAQRIAGAHAWPGATPALCAAMQRRLAPGSRIALVHATAYSDDRQVMRHLGDHLTLAGFSTCLVAPDHLAWADGQVRCIADGDEGRIDGIARFFPAEWLPSLPRRSRWQSFFGDAPTACNHPVAMLAQSKRLPLTWNALDIAVPTWRALLPETLDPRDAPWRRDDNWILKPALGRVGEGIGIRETMSARDLRRIRMAATLQPRHWIAQRRFDSLPLSTTRGDRHLCIGVFTVDGKAAGFYGRLARHPRIDKEAQDIAVLVSGEEVT